MFAMTFEGEPPLLTFEGEPPLLSLLNLPSFAFSYSRLVDSLLPAELLLRGGRGGGMKTFSLAIGEVLVAEREVDELSLFCRCEVSTQA